MSGLDFIKFGLVADAANLSHQIVRARSLLERNAQTEFEEEFYILLTHYLYCWPNRKYPRHFFRSSAIAGRIHYLDQHRQLILSLSTELQALAFDILSEYETYLFHWTETRLFIKKQRAYASTHRTRFFHLVSVRDGEKCSHCGSDENLKLDHIKPVSHGGVSEIENFQLLCFGCNAKKGKAERAAVYGGAWPPR